MKPKYFKTICTFVSENFSKNWSSLDLHFAINISGNSPFGTPALTKNAERYEW